jgi:5-methyltetrahydrofolate--homocysteine methyltransferase
MIGERINPTGRKIVLEALQEGNFEIVRQDAIAQVEAGATVLDVNAGVRRVPMKSPCCHK